MALCASALAALAAWRNGEKPVGRIEDERITESSGLAASRAAPGSLWTHNDSGDGPRLFRLNAKGGTEGVVVVEDAKAVDWEDIACFRSDDENLLLIADTGNNARQRPDATLYLLREPEELKDEQSSRPLASLTFTFDDGPHDCEALAVDVPRGRAMLAARVWVGTTPVYELPLPTADLDETAIARRVAELPVSTVSAMDISPDGRKLVVATYTAGYLYVRGEGESWAEALKGKPVRLDLPARQQGEGACFDLEGEHLHLSSEGAGQPLWKVLLPTE